MKRRQLLRSITAAGATGLAGCNSGTDDTSSTRRAPSTNENETATDTVQPTPDDTTPPVIEKFVARHTGRAGTLDVDLQGHDERRLDKASVTTSVTSQTSRVNAAEVTLNRHMRGRPGRMNEVSARLTDAAGNTTKKTVESYARQYDVLVDTTVEMAAVYIPFVGGTWKHLPDGYGPPAYGYYSVDDADVINRQIDLMQGHGIGAIQFNYSDSQNQPEYERFLEAELASEIEVEPLVFGWHWFLDDGFTSAVDRNVDYVRESLLERGNPATYDGRPIVTFWDVDALAWEGPDGNDVKDVILEEWGGFAEFIGYLRDRFTLGDGTRPYFVGDVHDNIQPNGTFPEHYAELNHQFDAVTTWFPVTGGPNEWDTVLNRVYENFRLASGWARRNGKGFIPTVFPGYEAADTGGYGGDSHLERTIEQFSQLLSFAMEFRTREPNRVNIASWNDWVEGHAIEPGIWERKNYGTDYLEVVEEFQRRE